MFEWSNWGIVSISIFLDKFSIKIWITSRSMSARYYWNDNVASSNGIIHFFFFFSSTKRVFNNNYKQSYRNNLIIMIDWKQQTWIFKWPKSERERNRYIYNHSAWSLNFHIEFYRFAFEIHLKHFADSSANVNTFSKGAHKLRIVCYSNSPITVMDVLLKNVHTHINIELVFILLMFLRSIIQNFICTP